MYFPIGNLGRDGAIEFYSGVNFTFQKNCMKMLGTFMGDVEKIGTSQILDEVNIRNVYQYVLVMSYFLRLYSISHLEQY